MDYYYAVGDDRRGPVSEEQFKQLAAQGVVTASTLVWREGMADWQPYGASMPVAAAAGAPAAVFGGVRCAHCGQTFPQTEVISLGTGFCCAACKPQAMQRLKEGVATSDAEATRQQYIKHEASVKSIGLLYFIGGVVCVLAGLGASIPALTASRSDNAGVGIVMLFVFVGLGVGYLFLGSGVRRLRPWTRIPVGILSGIGLLGFPIGTLINGYILYLVFSEKGKMVFSEPYRLVVEQTPHVKYKTSLLAWIVIGLLVLLVVGGIIAAVAGT